MTSRIPIVAGNWKMYKIRSEAADLVNGILPAVSKNNYCEVVVCPPFTAL
ncbi:MAG TPA: triose-phosphate isomerase, partial [Candidatus Sumerlaeia bacterium]|nr:triose-phosphate isomerase [Candidatus Sumerlaeia bacterium]